MYKDRKELYKNPRNKKVDWERAMASLEQNYLEIQPLIESASDPQGYGIPQKTGEKNLVFSQGCLIQNLPVRISLWNYPPQIMFQTKSSEPLTIESNQIKNYAELMAKIQEQTKLRVFFEYEQSEKTGETLIGYTIRPEYKNFQK